MGEISFSYNINTEPVYEARFRYWFLDSIEYGFAYQRYVAFSDASIFNGPVAITKVATGLYKYYDLFLDKKAHITTYNNLIKNFDTVQYNMQEERQEEFLNRPDGCLAKEYEGNWLSKDFLLDTLGNYFNSITEKIYYNDLNMYNAMYKFKEYNYARVNNDGTIGGSFSIGLNIIKNIYSKEPDKKILNKIQSISLKPFCMEMNIFDVYFGLRNEIIANKIPQIFLKRPTLQGNVINTLLAKYPDIFQLQIGQIVNGTTNDKAITSIKNIFSEVNDKYVTINDFIQGYGYGKVCSIFENAMASMSGIVADLITKYKGVIHDKFNTSYDNKSLEQFVLDRKLCIITNEVTAIAGFKDLQINHMYQCSKYGKSFQYNKAFFTKANGKDANGYYKLYFITKDNHNVYSYKYIRIDKLSKDMNMHNSLVYAQQDRNSMEIYNNFTEVNKSKNKLFISNDNILITKDKFDAVLGNDIINTFRDRYGIDLFINNKSLFRSNYNISLLNQYFIDRKDYYSSVFNQVQSLIKSKVFVSAPDFDTVIKEHLPFDYINTLHNNYAGMIIPLSRTRHQGYIDNIDIMVRKTSKDGYLDDNVSASVIPKDIAYITTLDLFFDKNKFDAYIEYKNSQITKSKVHAFINKDSYINKTFKYSVIEGSNWAQKNPAKIWSDKQLQAQKQGVKGHIEGILYATAIQEDVYAYESLFVDKTSYICYYNYDKTWAEDKVLKAKLNNQLTIDIKQQKGQMFDCVSPFIKEQLKGFYDYGIFSNRVICESNLFNQIQDIHRKSYNAGIRPEDFGNWAWIYETPDPFEGLGFNIDELLLPENDTRYENFEDIIFDKQNMRPRNPVKVINDNTFIAKYPIRHPLPEYSNVAINYEDSAVIIDNFYGIETEIMHTVFLKFYRIWQSKLFEFGTMTMVQSVKSMLEYMYAWIMEYFPVNEIEQALRVFKLIRWYGETSIIQNSQYIVTYEYDTLESKLNTGTCLIPNDLDTNDTMYVDAKLGVIRSNPIYINDGQTDISVTFEIDNRKNTTFTFSLSNTVGSVNIYINDVLVDTLSRSALNLTYELPYTGDINIIKIEKTASHNLNGTFYIGNIKVPNGTFKELSIEFDPTLKAGNKPLNEIAKKMISFANLHDNKDEAYDVIRKGNLGVGEIYKHLMEYWELHHQGKHKGKRLTIKEV